LAVLIGIVAAARIHAINPSDTADFHVYIYDLWWPTTLMWLTFCLVECITAVLRVDRVRDRLGFTNAVTAGLALWALEREAYRFVYADNLSMVVWNMVVACSLPLFLCTAMTKLLEGHIKPDSPMNRMPLVWALELISIFELCW